jgi:hypothetical protein
MYYYSFKSPIYVTKIDDDPLISWPPFFLKEFFHGEWVNEWVSFMIFPTNFKRSHNKRNNMISFLVCLCLRFYEMIQPISWFFSSTNHLNRNWESWFIWFSICVCVCVYVCMYMYVLDSMTYMIHQNFMIY